MPFMPRNNEKAEKIAWKLLGKPANIAAKKSARQRMIDSKLDSQVVVGGR